MTDARADEETASENLSISSCLTLFGKLVPIQRRSFVRLYIFAVAYICEEHSNACMRKGISGDEQRGEIVMYESAELGARVEAYLEQETVWLSPGQTMDLFGRDKSVISRHLRNIFIIQGFSCCKFCSNCHR